MFHFYTPHVPVILGSLCGSLFYAVTSKKRPAYKKIIFLIVTFLTGIIAAEFMANILSTLAPGEVKIGEPMGALLASSFAIRWMQFLQRYFEQKLLGR